MIEDQFLIAENNSIILPKKPADIQPSAAQFLTSSVQLGEHFNVSFENLLLYILLKLLKRRKELQQVRKLLFQKKQRYDCFLTKTKKTPIFVFSKEDDNLCTICQCDFRCYTNKKAWIQCINCINWVCGNCKKGSKRKQYECEI